MHGSWSDLDTYDTSVYLEYEWVMTILNLSLNVVGCIKDSREAAERDEYACEACRARTL